MSDKTINNKNNNDTMGRYFPEITKSGVIEKEQFKIERYYSVPFRLRVVISRTSVSIKEIKQYEVGSIIDLGKEFGSLMSMDVYVNSVPLYYGEVVINNDMFGIRITHIIDEKISSDRYLLDLEYNNEQIHNFPEIENHNMNMDRFDDVLIEQRIELGQAVLDLKKILDLGIGSIIQLEKNINDPIILYGNNVPIAYGKVVIIKELFGLEITDVL